ncbi:DinB family protein [Brevibacterium sp. GP-SGM9]|uniref:DinB family protein n=1 Tax=unclassified Brevibacterium TaxID=2614124 RepID=UPI001E5FBAD9|nr:MULTISPECIES: DinB family protein [unclassified Brevibacterium]MCD1284552.1 DinB family protein [Brevibacterium sp. CCUG 69071]MDK8435831.1 DinB family protein [Brevibacterium sp. H-BE7]
MSDPLIEPADAPSERQGLEEFLDYYRQVMRRKVSGLDSTALSHTIASSTLTLGGIIKHLSLVEESWFAEDILGQELGEPWADIDWKADPEWEFRTAADDSPEYLLGLYDRACERSREILAGIDDLDTLVARESSSGHRFNVRWVLIHMIEEYARHAGHADLIREDIDGVTGD